MIPPPMMPPPGSTPAKPAPPGRFVKKGAYMVCVTCDMAIEYCPGHASTADAQSRDGAETGLAKRIADCQGR